MYARAQTLTSYKHHNTEQYHSFISEVLDGRASDSQVLSGNIVLAEHAFNIDEMVSTAGAIVQFPAFTKGKRQLSGKEVVSTRSIANVKIHVEKAIGAVLQMYTMLESIIPINLVMEREGKEHPVL